MADQALSVVSDNRRGETETGGAGSGDRGRDVTNWPAVMAIALATFSVVMTEMSPVGLMTPIAGELRASVGHASMMISAPALLAALFAPTVVLAASDWDRRRILLGLLALLTIANLMSALAGSMGWMLLSRVVVGFCMGGVWAIAGGLAPRLMPPHLVGRATALIFGGVSAASVLGVPLGAIIGDIAGWRAFMTMAVFSVVVFLLSFKVLPSLPSQGTTTPSAFLATLGQRPVRAGLVLTLLLVAGHFMAYTFVRPVLQEVAAIEDRWIGGLLFIYGVAGVGGNFLAGAFAPRRVRIVLWVIAVGLALSMAALVGVGTVAPVAVVVLVLWGVAYGGVSVTLQTWMMKAAPLAIETVTALFVATFNIGIALGSFAGGRAVDGWGLEPAIWSAAALPAAGVVVLMFARPDFSSRTQ